MFARKSSFFKHYGILSFVVLTSVVFGHFAFKPAQTNHRCLAYFLSAWFVLWYIILCIVSSVRLYLTFYGYSGDIQEISSLYFITYSITTVVLYTIWLHANFKRYNMFCLLEDVLMVRKYVLGKAVTFFIAGTIFTFGVLFISLNYTMIMYLVSYEWDHVFLYISNVILMALFSNVSWILLWNIGFTLVTISFILSREFDKCTRDLEQSFHKSGILSDSVLYGMTDRHRALTAVVGRMDGILAVPLGLVMTVALSTLCGAVYALVSGQTFGMWFSATASSAIVLGVFLVALTDLNHKVTSQFYSCYTSQP